jgi:hypothetical protein
VSFDGLLTFRITPCTSCITKQFMLCVFTTSHIHIMLIGWLLYSSSVSNRSTFPVQFRFRFCPKLDCGSIPRKTKTVGNRPVLPPPTWHFQFTILSPIECLSSDRMVTWSICGWCTFCRSFDSRCQIWDRINICWVAIDTPRISHNI